MSQQAPRIDGFVWTLDMRDNTGAATLHLGPLGRVPRLTLSTGSRAIVTCHTVRRSLSLQAHTVQSAVFNCSKGNLSVPSLWRGAAAKRITWLSESTQDAAGPRRPTVGSDGRPIPSTCYAQAQIQVRLSTGTGQVTVALRVIFASGLSQHLLWRWACDTASSCFRAS